MSTEIATPGTSTELAISSDQVSFTPKQIATLEHLGIKDAPEGDRDLFFHQCKRTGLDPFAKQIYMIGRAKRKKQGDRWVDDGMSYTIQTGIDGYRLNGKRAARREGVSYQVSEPLWRGPNQGDRWDDIWLDPKNPPAAAKVSITVGDSTFTAVALYHEYVQYKMGTEPNAMWSKMPANQLRKCAEAAAWRLAFPDDFSGLVLEDAVQVIDEDGQPAAKRTVGRGNAGVRAALGIKQKDTEPVDVSSATIVEHQPAPSDPSPKPEPAQATATTAPEAKPATRIQVTALGKLFAKEKYDTLSDQIEWLANNNLVGDRKITGLPDLSTDEAAAAIEALQ